MTPCPGRWASATGANDDGGEDMKPATGCIIAATLALAFAVPSAAVEVDNLDAFQQHFGRYAPGGDCGKQPQLVVSPSGFAFEGGTALPAATRPHYIASFMCHLYAAITEFFLPYPPQPR